MGVVYEDVAGDGVRNVFAGDLGLAGWTVQLYFGGQLVASTSTDADGNYVFPNLGNSTYAYSVCVIPQAGYVRTQPVNGNACDGNGMNFFFSSSFMTWAENNFGWFMQ